MRVSSAVAELLVYCTSCVVKVVYTVVPCVWCRRILPDASRGLDVNEAGERRLSPDVGDRHGLSDHRSSTVSSPRQRTHVSRRGRTKNDESRGRM